MLFDGLAQYVLGSWSISCLVNLMPYWSEDLSQIVQVLSILLQMQRMCKSSFCKCPDAEPVAPEACLGY